VLAPDGFKQQYIVLIMLSTIARSDGCCYANTIMRTALPLSRPSAVGCGLLLYSHCFVAHGNG
jgi:hypothetical protein